LECAEHFSPCKRGEASDRPPGPHVRTVCRHADTVRDENRNQKIRNAIENELRVTRIDGSWWQFSLTERTAKEPSALSLLKISRDRNGALEVRGRSWREDGNLSARYWSEAAKEKEGPSGVFYYWKGERPLDPNAPQFDGVGEIRLESSDRASGFFTTRVDGDPNVNARTAGVYWRAQSRRHHHLGRSR
jgi:hypothetical protein